MIILSSDDHPNNLTLDRERVIQHFERHGVLLFRGFDLRGEQLISVTDLFTETYSPDSQYRARRFGHMNIGNVNPGDKEVGLHSEAAFLPTWPEVIWFYCHVPSSAGASTTLCDGVLLWKQLSEKTRRLFLATKPITCDVQWQRKSRS